MQTCFDILNAYYYQSLIASFHTSNVLLDSYPSKFINLNVSLLESILNKENFFVQVPSGYQKKDLLYANILYRLFLEQVLYADENPMYSVGTKVKANKTPLEFEVINQYENLYTIKEKVKGKKNQYYSPLIYTGLTRNLLRSNYTIIEGGLQSKTIENYKKIIDAEFKLNYVPTSFPKKSIIICSKSFWDSLSDIPIIRENLNSNLRNLIPGEYKSSTEKSIKSINIDNALFITSDYSTAYNQILKNNSSIQSIVLFDCKSNEILPILQDQETKRFSIVVYSSHHLDSKSFPVWRWLKEEIELIESL